MRKILFVCLGNICRSPMAEFILKDLVNKRNLEGLFYISSCGTSSYNDGADLYPNAKDILKEMNIPFTRHYAKHLSKEDYNNYDYIIGMDEENIKDIIRIIGHDEDKKVYKLLDFTNDKRDVKDPWYYGNFDKTYYDILYGCECLLDYILTK